VGIKDFVEYRLGNKKLSPSTRRAIETFEKILRIEMDLEKLKSELNRYVSKIPEEEMDVYISLTEFLREKLER